MGHYLSHNKVIVKTFLLHQFSVRALFCYLAIFNRCNDICCLNGGEPMSDHNRGSALSCMIQSRLYNGFTLCIQGGGGFIQEEDFGVSHQCTSYSNALFLASTQLGTTLSYQGIVAIRKCRYEIMNICIPCSFLDFFPGDVFLPIANVLSYGGIKEDRLLTDNTNVTPQPFEIEGTNFISTN